MSISALESGNISQNTVLSSLESFSLSALLHPQRPDTFKQFFFNLALPVVVYWKHRFAINHCVLPGSANLLLLF